MAAVVLYFIATFGMSAIYAILPPIETHMTADARVGASTVTVSGTTNLPDGAVIDYDVSNAEYGVPVVGGHTVVSNGEFSFVADVASLPAGKADVWLWFEVSPARQPVPVVLTYGPGGERMAGDQVSSDSGDYLLEDGFTIDLGEPPA